MSVVRNAFATKEEALADLAAMDLWPTTYVSERAEELPLHWHDVDNCGYVLEGHGYVLDAVGERLDLGPGDKLILPAGAVHAEGEMTERMVWIVGISEPANLMDALLPLHDPATSPLNRSSGTTALGFPHRNA
jgi:mannose-6-phosphate isomerase-like protein (cupin superfamily)